MPRVLPSSLSSPSSLPPSSRSKEEGLGDVFCRLAPFLKLYSTYTSGFEDAMKLLTEWTAKEKRFDSLVREFAVSEGWKRGEGGRKGGGMEGGRKGGRKEGGRRRGIEAVGGREGWKEREVEERKERREEGRVKAGWSRLGSSGGEKMGGGKGGGES